MNDDAIKKIAVTVITVFTVLSFLLPCALYYFAGMHIIAAAILFIIMIAFSVTMIYMAKERLEEIDGGQDNDVKHY